MARGALVALAVLAFAGFSAGAALAAPGGGLGPPAPQTDSGKTISEIYWVVFTICAVVFVLVEAALILFIVRFRRRPDVPEHTEGPQIHGNTRLEIIWTIIPALALAAIAVYVFARTPAVEASPNGQAVRIRVEAHQFYWQYEYENGAISINTLRLPVDTPVVLEITALDVDHSWWVPSLTGKKDAIPGRVNELSFTPQKEGTYEGWCAEHCGIQHTVMYTRVEVVSAAEFDRWVQDKVVTEASEELGRETWQGACAKCHGLEGEGDVGPPIAGNGTLLNRRALRQLVVYDGQDTPNIEGHMPAVGRGWITVQLDSLMAYIRSNQTLREGPASGGP